MNKFHVHTCIFCDSGDTELTEVILEILTTKIKCNFCKAVYNIQIEKPSELKNILQGRKKQ